MGKNAQRRRRQGPGTFTAAERVAAHAAQEAAGGGNPAKVRTALLAQPTRVGAITIPLFTGGIVLLLEEIGSPLAKPGASAPTNFQVFEALFALSRPTPEILEVRDQGAAAWRKAVFAFADSVPLADIPKLGEALGRQLALAESTVIGGSAEKVFPASSGETAGANGAKKNTAAPASLPPQIRPNGGSPQNPTG